MAALKRGEHKIVNALGWSGSQAQAAKEWWKNAGREEYITFSKYLESELDKKIKKSP